MTRGTLALPSPTLRAFIFVVLRLFRPRDFLTTLATAHFKFHASVLVARDIRCSSLYVHMIPKCG
ncbi:hypothetical protein ANAPC5_01476 [Anaplasma phagocytophilum]|nr:hypothetical protein ANAPC5_01476 [Anaplasma phagocytophilum]